ncbi:hypothetical protein CJP72_22735 [Citrobacter sp. NCU1]|nr:hypothetical protein [Citrobacter sp. NCU1]
MRRLPLIAAAGLFSIQLFAAPLPGFSFDHKDWELSCDNTGTCRAAGYGVKTGEVSVLLTRQAGPGQHVNGLATFAQTQNDIPIDANVSMFIDDQPQGTLAAKDKTHFRFDSSQITALVEALIHDKKIEIALNGQRKTLSSAGANAVFLKMDEYQKRIGTRSALLRKGKASEENVLAAVPAPVIIAAPVTPSAPATQLTTDQRKRVEAKLTNDCDDWDNENISAEDRQLTLTAIDKSHSLIQGLCWRAAYNEGYAMWVVDNALTSDPQLITTDATSYADGVITFFNKGRGIADCVSGEEWVWDGKTFVRSLKYTTGDCREIVPGGTWMLPTFVSQVEAAQKVSEHDNAR